MQVDTSVHGDTTVKHLRIGDIERVHISELPQRYVGQYSERPSRYMIKIKGVARLRRVYATPIGNVSVLYIKTPKGLVYCESALTHALYERGNKTNG